MSTRVTLSIKKVGEHRNAAQNNIMIEFMNKHKDLARGYVKGNRLNSERLWMELTDKLNEEGPPIKTLNRWRKAWSDWKNDVRKKCDKSRNDSANYILNAFDEGVAKAAGLYEITEDSFTFVDANSTPPSEASTSDSICLLDPDDIKDEVDDEEDENVLDNSEHNEPMILKGAASSNRKRRATDDSMEYGRKVVKRGNTEERGRSRRDSSITSSSVESISDSSFELNPNDIKQEEIDTEETAIVQEAFNGAIVVDVKQLKGTMSLDMTSVDEICKNTQNLENFKKSDKLTSAKPTSNSVKLKPAPTNNRNENISTIPNNQTTSLLVDGEDTTSEVAAEVIKALKPTFNKIIAEIATLRSEVYELRKIIKGFPLRKILPAQPFDDIQKFFEFERNLQEDEETLQTFVDDLRSVSTNSNYVKNCWRKIFTDALAEKFCWKGTDEKHNVRSLTTATAIQSAVKALGKDETEYIHNTKSFFQYAKNRQKQRKQYHDSKQNQ